MASAIAAYWSARVAAKATPVAGPARRSPSRSETLAAAAGPPAPTLNTKPPDTGCESAETTRKVTV